MQQFGEIERGLKARDYILDSRSCAKATASNLKFLL